MVTPSHTHSHTWLKSWLMVVAELIRFWLSPALGRGQAASDAGWMVKEWRRPPTQQSPGQRTTSGAPGSVSSRAARTAVGRATRSLSCCQGALQPPASSSHDTSVWWVSPLSCGGAWGCLDLLPGRFCLLPVRLLLPLAPGTGGGGEDVATRWLGGSDGWLPLPLPSVGAPLLLADGAAAGGSWSTCVTVHARRPRIPSSRSGSRLLRCCAGQCTSVLAPLMALEPRRVRGPRRRPPGIAACTRSGTSCGRGDVPRAKSSPTPPPARNRWTTLNVRVAPQLCDGRAPTRLWMAAHLCRSRARKDPASLLLAVGPWLLSADSRECVLLLCAGLPMCTRPGHTQRVIALPCRSSR